MPSNVSSNALKIARNILDDACWKNGYDFIGGENFFIDEMSLKNSPSKHTITLLFALVYKTKRREVRNNIVWVYDYDKIFLLERNINELETLIITKTGTKDDVFGSKFNEELFNKLKYSELGWKIVK